RICGEQSLMRRKHWPTMEFGDKFSRVAAAERIERPSSRATNSQARRFPRMPSSFLPVSDPMYEKTVGRPMEILLIEDSLMDAQVTINARRDGQLNHRLTLVRDGDEALEFLNRQGRFTRAPRPDIILLDLNLPKRGGLEVLDEVRADYQLRNIPVVVLTASDDEDVKSRCEQSEVESYIT